MTRVILIKLNVTSIKISEFIIIKCRFSYKYKNVFQKMNVLLNVFFRTNIFPVMLNFITNSSAQI